MKTMPEKTPSRMGHSIILAGLCLFGPNWSATQVGIRPFSCRVNPTNATYRMGHRMIAELVLSWGGGVKRPMMVPYRLLTPHSLVIQACMLLDHLVHLGRVSARGLLVIALELADRGPPWGLNKTPGLTD